MNAPSLERDDTSWMLEALSEATLAAAAGEVPIGAIVVLNRAIVGRGHNSPISLCDPTAHAEIQALRAAARTIGNYRLIGATLYVTVEPCLMCMGALLHARVSRVVFGCHDAKFGAAGSLYDFSTDERLNHRIDVTAGVAAAEGKALLQRFFQQRRGLDRGNGNVEQ